MTKIIRLTSEASDGSFDNSFNENITIDAKSSVALQNCSFTVDIHDITIGQGNDPIKCKVKGTTLQSTTLKHGIYDEHNHEELFDDIQTKMNSSLTSNGRDIGTQWKCSLNNQRKVEIQAKQHNSGQISNFLTFENSEKTSDNFYQKSVSTSSFSYNSG